MALLFIFFALGGEDQGGGGDDQPGQGEQGGQVGGGCNEAKTGSTRH